MPIGDGRRARRIGNWLNHKEPGSGFMQSDPSPDDAGGVPDNWSGDFTHQIFSRRGPMQIALGNDPAGRPHMRARRSNRPQDWAEIIWLGGSTVAPVVSRSNRSVRWPGWRPSTTLIHSVQPHRADKILKLNTPAHPATFRFAVRQPDGYSHEMDKGGGVRLLDDQGVQYMRIARPFGWDSSTTVPGPSGTRRVRVTLTYVGKIAGLLVFELEPNQDDLAAATYPVFLDPPITISGTTDIDDNLLYLGLPNSNWGAYQFLFAGDYSATIAGEHYHSVTRVDVSAIPAGATITSFIYNVEFSVQQANSQLDFHRITDANDWVEGTFSGGSAGRPGESCWNAAKFGAQNWAGSVGCSTSGTDYDASIGASWVASEPSTKATTLPNAWAQNWLDGARVSNGFILIDAAGNLGYKGMQSTETLLGPSHAPTFDLIYTLAPTGGTNKAFFLMGSM